ncbi:hypothetical protein FPQ18DRAFT_425540 [Pyronema domesticum]|nr:hypothetical protein FPQ18DRAFT_425540 [Pyronema domesticum]
MSQDLLHEFGSFHAPPKPAQQPQPSRPPPPADSSFSRQNPDRNQGNGNYGGNQRQVPRHGYSASVSHSSSQSQQQSSFGYGHRHSPSATTFDDLLGIMDTGLKSTKFPPSQPPPPPLIAVPSAPEKRRSQTLNGGVRPSFGHVRNNSRGNSVGGGGAYDPYASGLLDVGAQRGTKTSELYAGFDDFAPPVQKRGHKQTLSLVDIDDLAPATAKIEPLKPTSVSGSRPGTAASNRPSTAVSNGNGFQNGGAVLATPGPTTAAEDDDDDFGDFVTSPSRTPQPPTGFQAPPQLVQPMQGRRGSLGARRPSLTPLKPATNLGTLLEAFEPSRTPSPMTFEFPARSPAKTPQPIPTSVGAYQQQQGYSHSRSNSAHQPPSNSSHSRSISLQPFSSAAVSKPSTPAGQQQFPPVFQLLQTLTPLFLLPQVHLLEQLKGLPFPVRQRVLSHPKTKAFLESVCELGRVAGRIIAGRRRRGGVSNGGGKGMGGLKLKGGAEAGSDAQKEEREVRECIRIWKEGLGRLKAAMGEQVPELEDQQLHGTTQGTGTGRCGLCGLGQGESLPGLKERLGTDSGVLEGVKILEMRGWDQGKGQGDQGDENIIDKEEHLYSEL